MIVLRRLAHGVWSHAGARFTEWLGAAPLFGIGYVLYAQPDALYTTPSFAKLAQWAEAGVWSNVLMLYAFARLLALFVNGTFKGFRHSPLIRFVVSCLAAWFWLLFTVGIYTAWKEGGGSPTGIVAYGTFVLLELRNAYASRVDMASARGRALHAGLDG